MRFARRPAPRARWIARCFVAEPGFKWDAFLAANANASLFGDRKCVDLRIPSGKPGVEGGKALETYAAQPESRQRHADHAAAARSRGAGIGVVHCACRSGRDDCGVSRRARRAARLDRGAARAAATTRVARDARVPRRRLRRQPARRAAGDREARAAVARRRAEHDAVEAAVADVARYDIFELSEAWLAGDAARTLRIMRSLEAAGRVAHARDLATVARTCTRSRVVAAMLRAGHAGGGRRAATRACGASGRRRSSARCSA